MHKEIINTVIKQQVAFKNYMARDKPLGHLVIHEHTLPPYPQSCPCSSSI
jgi:hypothetical protein